MITTRRFACLLVATALAVAQTVTSTAAVQPGPGTPPVIHDELILPELPAMMLTPADLDAAGLPDAGVGGGQTFARLADAVASRTYGQSRGLLRLSAVSASESTLAQAGWRRFHERRLGTVAADDPSLFAVEAASGVETYATARGAAEAFAFYADPQVALRMSPVENLPVDDAPTIGDESLRSGRSGARPRIGGSSTGGSVSGSAPAASSPPLPSTTTKMLSSRHGNWSRRWPNASSTASTTSVAPAARDRATASFASAANPSR